MTVVSKTLSTFSPILRKAPYKFSPVHLSGCQLWLDASRLQIGAAQFTAANSEYLSVADHADLRTGNIDASVAYWVRSDVIDGSARMHASKWGQLDANREYQIYEISGVVYCDWRLDALGTNASVNSGGTTISAGQWAFVCVWHDATLNTLNISINNGAAQSIAANGGNAGAGSFAIGTRAITTPDQFMDGRIAKVGFWKKVLSAAEITSLYNSVAGLYYSQLSGSLLTSLISYWNLTEASGQRNDSTANVHHLTDNNTVSCAPSMTPETPADGTLAYIVDDLSGNGIHPSQATETNKPSYQTGEINGKPVVRFDGVDNYMSRTAFNLGLPITGVVVIRHSNITPDTQIMGWGGANRHTVITDSQNFRVCLAASCGVAASTPFQNNVTTIRAYTIDALGAVIYYVNGAADGTAAPTLTDPTGSGTLYLGTLTGSSQFLPGDIAEVILYNRVLSAVEIARLSRYLGRKYGIAIS